MRKWWSVVGVLAAIGVLTLVSSCAQENPNSKAWREFAQEESRGWREYARERNESHRDRDVEEREGQ